MPRIDLLAVLAGRGLGPAFLALMLALAGLACPGFAAPAAPVEGQIGQLDGIRQQCVAAALAAQQRERSIGALDLAIKVMERGVETKTRELAQRRTEQEALLGALERLALAPPEALALAPEGPIDRQRSAILIAAAVPALAARAQELAGQLAALNNVRSQVETRRKEIDDARAALAKGREQLAQLVSRRNLLIGELLHDSGKAASATDTLGQATDLFDLIKRADAAAEQRDKELLLRLRLLYGGLVKGGAAPADPTRPKSLRALDTQRAEMVWPVAGELMRRFGEADRNGRPSQGLTLQAMPGAVVTAPFDGRVEFAGPFRGYGLILIIRHGGGYHSLLADLGHVDVTPGQWLLAGEPVGSLAGGDEKGAGASLYFELRREGRPVDPQSRLVSRDQKTEDVRVRE